MTQLKYHFRSQLAFLFSNFLWSSLIFRYYFIFLNILSYELILPAYMFVYLIISLFLFLFHFSLQSTLCDSTWMVPDKICCTSASLFLLPVTKTVYICLVNCHSSTSRTYPISLSCHVNINKTIIYQSCLATTFFKVVIANKKKGENATRNLIWRAACFFAGFLVYLPFFRLLF